MSAWKHWSLEESGAGLTVWVDVAGQSQNVFSAEVLGELALVLVEIEQRPEPRFVLFRSRKPNSFFAGADIREFASIETSEQARDVARAGQELFARIAALPAPTVAIIQGVCLGGGLEMALACKYRVAVDSASTRLGLPETELGILPGWGGTQRLPRLVGEMQAISMILQARKLTASAARRSGLVDLVVSPESLDSELGRITTQLAETGSLGKPIVKRTWMGWFLNETRWGRSLVIGATQKKIAGQLRHYPALGKALEAIRWAKIDSSRGFAYEQEAIAELLLTTTCKNLVRLFLLREKARSVSTWGMPGERKMTKSATIAVLGGGTMGAGIVHLLARSGFRVVLKEVQEDALNVARERIDQAYAALVARRSLTPPQAEAEKNTIVFTTGWEEMQSAEIVIEAVPETLPLKQAVFRELAEKCPPETVLASNTSALSITEIANVVTAPERVAGLHFFNPVHRMDLVEVVRARKSSDATLEQLLGLCRLVGKTPILVQDSPGFVVNRVLMPYLDEAVKIAVERTARGQDPGVIDKEMRRFGMPMGPLELLDQVGLDVAVHVANSMTIVFGEKSLTATVLQRMIDAGRLGRKTSNGFFAYPHGQRGPLLELKSLLSELEVDLPEEPATPLDEELSLIQQRLVLAMVNEAGRCLDEQVVGEDWMIDLAMVLGTGFAPFEGGPLALARRLPSAALLETLETLAKTYGSRYQPAAGLRGLLLKG